MTLYNEPQEAAAPMLEQIAAANHILVLTHVSPDGDAIGSLLGVTHVLRGLGKQVTPLALPPLPDYVQWLPGIETVHLYEPGVPLPAADLIFVVDTASMNRLGDVYPEHAAQLDLLPMIVVDHHVTNDGRGTLNLIRPATASACELLYTLFVAMNVTISADAATCLMLGMTTDTQSFQTSSTNADSLRAAAELLALGAEHQQVVSEVYRSLPFASTLLIGQSLSTLQRDGAVAWAFVSRAMLEATQASDDASDEVVQMMQRIGGIEVLVLFKEHENNTTRLSLRSRPPYNVSKLAQELGGGGHSQAAGATLFVGLEQAAALVLPRLKAIVEG